MMGLSHKRRIEQDILVEVVIEILLRLPAISLMKFKCLSKLWASILCSGYFSSRFLTAPSRPRPRLYLCLVDFCNYRKSVILSSAPDSTNPSSFIVNGNMTISRRGGYISQNLRGFMCYTFSNKLRIYNPATRQFFTLPAVKPSIIPPRETQKLINYYYLGHDPLSDQYKVLCSFAPNLTTMPENWVFVIKPQGGSWKKVAQTPPGLCPYHPVRRGQCINGVIYYLAWIDKYNSVLVSFDIRSEEIIMSQVPRRDGDELHESRVKKGSLIEYGGKVTVLDSTHLKDKGMMLLWVLEDARNKEWSNKTLLLQPSQLHLLNNNIIFNVEGTTQSGKVILLPPDWRSPFHILCYDLQRNDLTKIEIKGIPVRWFSKAANVERHFDVMFMDQSESVIYLEA